MRNARLFMRNAMRWKAILLALCLCQAAGCALADAYMPVFSEPPAVPVYWQLTQITLEPQIRTENGFTAVYDASGFSLDLSDPLMAESISEAGESDPSVCLTIENSARAQKQCYKWTPLPVYLEPGQTYPIEITGASEAKTETLDSLLTVSEQGKQVLRVSAGCYNGHPDAATYALSPLSTDEMVVSFVVRDVNDMFRLRAAYTYRLFEGLRPYPTPVPGFVATEAPAEIPSFYEAVAGQEGLWAVTTAPGEYRAWGVMTGEGPNFFPADENGVVVMDAPPVTPDEDFENFVAGFVPWSAQEVPAAYAQGENGVFSFVTRDGETLYRAFGRVDGGEAAFYPCDETGAVEDGAQAVTPQADYDAFVKGFGAARPQETPALYEANENGVYAFTGRDGVKRCRVFGRLDGAEPAFYPCDETGALSGEPAVTPAQDFEAYVKGFDATDAGSVPSFYDRLENGVYTLADREGAPLYRVWGVKDGQAPAWYACDETGRVADDAQAVLPETDFVDYVKGFVAAQPESVPIYYEAAPAPGVSFFEDNDGALQYRVYGSLDRGENAWYPANENGAVAGDALPVEPASDLASIPVPRFQRADDPQAPEFYEHVAEGLYAVEDREGNRLYRAWGDYDRYLQTGANAYYPADENGVVADGAQSVEPARDYADYAEGFVPREPQNVPAFYEAGENGVYSFVGRDGQTQYRVFGRVNGQPAAWHAADANGEPLSPEGAPTSGEEDFAAHIKGFAPAEPDGATVPYYYVAGENGVYSFVNRAGETEYRVWGEKDRSEPAWYAADANGNLLSEDVAPIVPEQEFANEIKGFAPATPAESAVPFYYEAGENGVYSFVNRAGETEYRAFGQLDRGEPAWYAADETGALLSEDAQPVVPDEEFANEIKGFVPAAPDAATVPSYYVAGENGVYSFVNRAGETEYRVWGEKDRSEPGWYAADETGALLSEDAQPIVPDEEFANEIKGFVPAAPDAATVPSYYVAGENGVYSFVNRAGETEYRVWGEKDRSEPGWYAADANGNLLSEGAQPIVPEHEFANEIKGFVPAAPDADAVPPYYIAGENGVYSFVNRDGATEYRVFGQLDRGEPAWYVTDETGALRSENAAPVAIEEEMKTLPTPRPEEPVAAATPGQITSSTAVTLTMPPTTVPEATPAEAVVTDAPAIVPEQTGALETAPAAVPGQIVSATAQVLTAPASAAVTAQPSNQPAAAYIAAPTAASQPTTAVTPGEILSATAKVVSMNAATEVPATEAPATEVPATEIPATEVPVTEAPATEVPATEAPATEVPATEAPATEVPVTEAPTTEVPVTEAPATEAPAPTVEATAEPEKETGGSKWWIALVAAAVAAIGGGVGISASRKKNGGRK